MNDLAETIDIERDGAGYAGSGRGVAPRSDAKVKGTVPPVGALGVSGGTVQVPPTRDGDPPSLTGACDTFVILL